MDVMLGGGGLESEPPCIDLAQAGQGPLGVPFPASYLSLCPPTLEVAESWSRQLLAGSWDMLGSARDRHPGYPARTAMGGFFPCSRQPARGSPIM